MGTSDPVFLGYFDPFNIIKTIQVINQLIRILRDLKHPLAFHLTDYRTSTPLTDAVYDLFICQTTFTGGTPVNGHLCLVGKTCLKKLEKDPLCPFVIRRICCVYLTLPVKGITKCLQLFFKPGNIIFCHLPGMDLILDRIILRRKPESIPAHRIQYIIPLHPPFPRHNIQCRIWTRMPHMKPLPGWIRKLYQGIILWFTVITGSLERFFILPYFLPLFFDLVRIISLTHRCCLPPYSISILLLPQIR